MNLIHLLLFLNSAEYLVSKDVNYVQISRSLKDPTQIKADENRRRRVDIFTNDPDVQASLRSYQTLHNYTHRYIYPKSHVKYIDNQYHFPSEKIPNRKKGHVTFIDKNIAPTHSSYDLQSDFGTFESDNKAWIEKIFNKNARPRFYTSKNHSESYMATPKIPTINNKTASKTINTKINDLLKKYLVNLYRKKYYNDDKEVLESEVDYEDNIETLETSQENPNNFENFYEIADDFYHKLNATKSKFLDPSKLTFLKNSTNSWTNKFLSLFTVIQFPNTRCTAATAINFYEGTCYYLSECNALNGTAMGSCANGYGVCCVFLGTCGGASNQNCSYFESPGYPNYYPTNGTVLPPPPPVVGGNGTIDPRLRYQQYQFMMFMARQESTANSLSCMFQVVKNSKNVRQLRVDFLDLELRGPTNGTCTDEKFVITGQNTNDVIPTLCGYNTGQHLYVDVSDVTGPIQFGIIATAVERKRFRIRICQITGCNGPPENCLQYFTGVQNVITSFNYEQASSLARSTPSYFNNLNYGVCVRKESGYCTITYTNIQNGTAFPFQLNNVVNGAQPTVPPGQAGVEIFGCPDDYIVIKGVRLCGDRLNDGSMTPNFNLNAPITANNAGPFVLPVKTNENTVGRGFKLFYTQNRC